MTKLVLAALLALLVAAPAFADDPIRPDPKLTPGATDPAVTQANVETTICRKGGYTSSVRNVSAAVKKQVFAEYKIVDVARRYEVDHLISLELGGSNAVQNLWPQSYVSKPWNAHVKDKLENRLHALVCKGAVTLKDAQDALRGDWIAAYGKYVK